LPEYLIASYGPDWIRRPLLLQQLWTPEELREDDEEEGVSEEKEEQQCDDNPQATAATSTTQTRERKRKRKRHLSLAGLLETNVSIPYFTDARLEGALSPDQTGRVQDIVRNMTAHGAPHKIGSQLLVQAFPEWIQEVAPVEILTPLFGDYFTADAVKGSGPYRFFPALTTVPVFVASTATADTTATTADKTHQSQSSPAKQPPAKQPSPFTALHCEPIGNIAVQLAGRKVWTLVRPEFSAWLQPTLAPDGRAFYAAQVKDYVQRGIPTYTNVVTAAGDALWVPPWTWHRVDYAPEPVVAAAATPAAATTAATVTTETPSSCSEEDNGNSNDGGATCSSSSTLTSAASASPSSSSSSTSSNLAIGASLFHFRFQDFVRNHPLFAVMILPAMVQELVGYKTQ